MDILRSPTASTCYTKLYAALGNTFESESAKSRVETTEFQNVSEKNYAGKKISETFFDQLFSLSSPQRWKKCRVIPPRHGDINVFGKIS